MRRQTLLVVYSILLIVLLSACGLPNGSNDDDNLAQNAVIEGVEVVLLESFPVQANAIVTGSLPDGCTRVVEQIVTREDDTFIITLKTSRFEDAACTNALTDFEETVPLDVEGLPAGRYTVLAGDISTTFALDVDNVPQNEAGEND